MLLCFVISILFHKCEFIGIEHHQLVICTLFCNQFRSFLRVIKNHDIIRNAQIQFKQILKSSHTTETERLRCERYK